MINHTTPGENKKIGLGIRNCDAIFCGEFHHSLLTVTVNSPFGQPGFPGSMHS